MLVTACAERDLDAAREPARPVSLDGTIDITGFAGAAEGSVPRFVADFVPVGDLDGDGFDDLLLAEGGASADLSIVVRVLYGRPDRLPREFTSHGPAVLEGTLPSASTRFALRGLGDLDGDGRAEWGWWSDGLRIFRGGDRDANPRAAGDAWRTVHCGDQPAFNAAGDVDGDGLADLAFGTPQGVRVLTGAVVSEGEPEQACHDGRLAIDTTESLFVEEPVPAGDLDGDGYDDLVVQTGDAVLLRYGGDTFGGRPVADAVLRRGDGDAGPTSSGIRAAARGTAMLLAGYHFAVGLRERSEARVLDRSHSRLTGDHRWADVSRAVGGSVGCGYHWAGDLDGDGWLDVVSVSSVPLCERRNADADSPRDAVSLWYGRDPATEATRSPDARLRFGQPDTLVERAAGIGDFDGDGFDDFAVLQSRYLDWPEPVGLYIVYGASR
ncbi:MAG: VCBS repeat-containing protein [Myxococcota bacterium]